MRTCATVAELLTIPYVDQELAEDIRRAWMETPERKDARRTVDAMLHDFAATTFGVWHLGTEISSGDEVYYSHSGEQYRKTVIFIGDRLIVDSFGNLEDGTNLDESTATNNDDGAIL